MKTQDDFSIKVEITQRNMAEGVADLGKDYGCDCLYYRNLRLESGRQVSLLAKYNFTEQDAWQLCEKAGLLSSVYAFTDRGGCWFCPNAKLPELRHLYDHHPDLWARMLELQAIPGKATEKFNRTQKFSDIDVLFRQEDGKAALRQAA